MPRIPELPERKPWQEFSEVTSVPAHFVAWVERRNGGVDFDALRTESHQILVELEPIRLPSREMWELMHLQKSLKIPFDFAYYWALHAYRGDPRLLKRIEEYNQAIEDAGITPLARGEEPAAHSDAAIIQRGISEQRISQAFLDAWFHLGMLFRQLIDLRSANDERAHALENAAAETVIGQRVWYARWVTANSGALLERREDTEADLADLCRTIVTERRKLPPDWVWKAPWFARLLPAERQTDRGPSVKATERGANEGLLRTRFTRLTVAQVRALAGHKSITANLLPPLTIGAFPTIGARHP
jgi:hypothetical protein